MHKLGCGLLLAILICLPVIEVSAQTGDGALLAYDWGSVEEGVHGIPDAKWDPVTDQDKTHGRKIYLSYVVRGKRHSYPAFIPAAYFRGQLPPNGFPLVLELHGGPGGYGKRLSEIGSSAMGHANRYGYFVAVPVAISPYGFNAEPEHVIPPVMHDMKKRFPIDEKSNFLLGYSNGANGTYVLLSLFPGRFAGAAPVSGAPDRRDARTLLKTPMLILQHAADPVINSQYNRALVRDMRKLGAQDGVDFLYREELGDGHVGMPYLHEDIFDWFEHIRHRSAKNAKKEIEWSLEHYPWFRKQVPYEPASDNERQLLEAIAADYEAGDYEQATAHNREARRHRLGDGSAWYALGVMLYDQRKYEPSIEAFKKAGQCLYDNPRDRWVAHSYIWIGRNLDILKRREEAVVWYAKARDTRNPYQVAHKQYGITGSARDLGELGMKEVFRRVEREL